jgi:hypothetical protein
MTHTLRPQLSRDPHLAKPGRFWGLGQALVLQSIGVLRWFRVAPHDADGENVNGKAHCQVMWF